MLRAALPQDSSPLSGLRRLGLAAALAASLVTPALAQGDEVAEVNRLLRAGQYAEALGKADQALAARPKDAQLRFLKGVIQSESGKTADAVITFTQLTEDFPELPEPYNNLAVLYAGQGQFDRARVALEMAIRTNPSYATAHENLGDVYAKLASQAYSKALQLDGSNTGVAPKLTLIRNLFAGPGAARPASAAMSAPGSSVRAAVPTAAAPVAAPAPSGAAPADVQRDVQAAIQAWSQAWSAKNMGGYLGAYSPDFVPASGQTRSAWEAERRNRIEPRSRIAVSVSDLSITGDATRATARFRQDYSSDGLNIVSRKTLEMVKVGNRWLIVRETSSS